MTGTIGHNTPGGDKVKEFVAQIVQSEREKAGIATDIKEIYASAKEAQVDTKALRKVVRKMLQSPTKRAEEKAHQDTVEMYLLACGILD